MPGHDNNFTANVNDVTHEEDIIPAFDQREKVSRAAELVAETLTDLGMKGAWEPTIEIMHAFDPTFLSDHLRSDVEIRKAKKP